MLFCYFMRWHYQLSPLTYKPWCHFFTPTLNPLNLVLSILPSIISPFSSLLLSTTIILAQVLMFIIVSSSLSHLHVAKAIFVKHWYDHVTAFFKISNDWPQSLDYSLTCVQINLYFLFCPLFSSMLPWVDHDVGRFFVPIKYQ